MKDQSKTTKSRGSRFRGVSKNGSKFQVFIMIHKKKRFIGVFEDEETAAKVYDKLAIIFHGHKAKTNFNYKVTQLEEMMAETDSYRERV
eukprot:CAMPEP_0205832544 /NCGR_PEP_ID=MMETSP0206-20130828/47193_1 /ASSEMBLY_ACC=CAM_ASM_000279 /TAXON_ID=36767 /ORGANISM="Euplotes focardii, Strain TN1" /LENGTH=88 /DNA_ID=CAMNT_0053138161 /DNA_START=77 /DNA_END=343 /DNA_ORIENTATION=-